MTLISIILIYSTLTLNFGQELFIFLKINIEAHFGIKIFFHPFSNLKTSKETWKVISLLKLWAEKQDKILWLEIWLRSQVTQRDNREHSRWMEWRKERSLIPFWGWKLKIICFFGDELDFMGMVVPFLTSIRPIFFPTRIENFAAKWRSREPYNGWERL